MAALFNFFEIDLQGNDMRKGRLMRPFLLY